MNSDNIALVNRLILLVLSLILVCLVMLVIRAYQKPLEPDASSAVAAAPPLVVGEAAPVQIPSVQRAESPRRPSPTNTQRLVAGGRPALSDAPVADSTTLASETPAGISVAQFDTLVAVHESARKASGGAGHATSNQPGEITGIVTLAGTPMPEIPIDMGPTCGYHFSEKRTTRHFVVGPNGGLANVLVYVRGAEQLVGQFSMPAEVPLLDQIGCMYEPYVMSVMVGQRFRVRNSDPVLHNVHATPKSNQEFNFGQPLQGQVTERSFSKPESFIRIKCDVHPWMFAYVSAMPHPYFAVTDTNGFFRLPAGLRSGGYTVIAWHMKAGDLSSRIELRDNGPNVVNFQLSAPIYAQGRIAKAE